MAALIAPYHLQNPPVTVQEYRFEAKDNTAIDFFALNPDDQTDILQRMDRIFKSLETFRPAEGYQVHFIGSNSGKNPTEAKLQAYGEGGVGTDLEMPKKDPCPFCQAVAKDKQIPGFNEPVDSSSRVIETLQGNALVVSKEHKEHWFQNGIEEQRQMLLTCKKVIDQLSRGGPFNYELHIHIGTVGHQKIPHTHVHVLTGTNSALRLYYLVGP